MKVYELIARELEDKNSKYGMLEKIAKEYLPRGSGFDCGCKIIEEKRYQNRIIIKAEFHAMNENGYYVGWYTYKIIVKPTFQNGLNFVIKGRDYNGLREYVGDCVYEALTMEVVK